MVADIFLGWAIGQVLSDALGLARRGLSRNEQQEIRARTVERLSADLPQVLAEAIGAQLSAPLRGVGDLSEALADQLRPLLGGWFEPGSGVRESGEQLLARLDLTYARLVELTEASIVASAHDVAAQQGGLPLWSTHQKLDRIIEQSGPRVTDTLMSAPECMVGRRHELEELARQKRTVVVHGMGGVGKTALVRALAAEVRDRFADGRFEVDLHGFTPGFEPRSPDLVLAELLRQVGFPPAEVPADLAAKSERWRAWLADRAVLLILDNARSAGDVQALLPGAAPRCLVIVTSRNRLDDLDASYRLAVDTLPEPDAVALLRKLSGRDEDFAEIARLCGCLPLALRAVGPLLGRIPAADLAVSLGQVDELDQGVRTAFAVSYGDLSAELQRLLRWCAFHPGPDLDSGSAAAIWGLPESIAAIRLDDLAKRNLLLTTVSGRYAFHDLFRAYARAHADRLDTSDAETVRDRVFYSLMRRASHALDTGSSSWLMGASEELETAATEALAIGWRMAGPFAGQVGWWLRLSARLACARKLYLARAEAAERSEDRSELGEAWFALADIARLRGEFGEATEGFGRAFALFEEAGRRDRQGGVLWCLAEVARASGDSGAAASRYGRALAFQAEVGNQAGQADAWLGLGDLALERGDHREAADAYWQALALHEAIGNRSGRADALQCLANLARVRGEVGEAAGLFAQALALYNDIGDRRGQANVSYRCGSLAEALGETKAACDAYRKARDLYQEIGNLVSVDRCAEALERLGCE